MTTQAMNFPKEDALEIEREFEEAIELFLALVAENRHGCYHQTELLQVWMNPYQLELVFKFRTGNYLCNYGGCANAAIYGQNMAQVLNCLNS